MKEKKKVSVADMAAILVYASLFFFFVYLVFSFFAFSSSFQSIVQSTFLGKIFAHDEGDDQFNDDEAEIKVDIDWKEQYPFSEETLPAYAIANKGSEVTGK